ncbi:endonuclease/exonuclease/phosphatase family protein [Denitromonas iodatirespirans]|uniref:Endonuclease/exonuclease/phosphatase family protein n=1 Tax=Denitromonas iodatirespirans TaxID=2795389 RepID=A0A944H8Y1_DENI1|nr:endonuclease/exonuclease/phosphatase family protein [Denitromonas iodatirespirans]MBT0962813.1 endonuclease/exonuclease/phosphatase family protein [Denitromonas iodatirespirans]
MLRFASYNVHRCVGVDGRHAPARILAVLKALGADAIALQEVEATRDESLDCLRHWSRELQMQVVYGPTMAYENTQYGNALLTRLPVAQSRRLDLTLHRREPRGAIIARLEHGDQLLGVIATHLGLRPYERRHQVQQILAQLDDEPALPRVLMGDINEWLLWGRPLRHLHRYFSAVPHRRSFPSRWPLFALDRIWVKPRMSLRRIDTHRTPLTRIASDHLPLVADIDF